MNKKEFYKEQAQKSRDFASKFPERDLLSLFEEWAESKDFSEEDKKEIWEIARNSGINEEEKEARNRG